MKSLLFPNQVQKLAFQILGVIFLAIVTVVSLEVTMTMRHERQRLTRELQRDAQTLAESIEHTLIALVESGHQPTIRRVVQNHAMTPHIKELVLIDHNGQIVAYHDRVKIGQPYDASHIQGLSKAIHDARHQHQATQINLSFTDEQAWIQVMPIRGGVFHDKQKAGAIVVIKDTSWIQSELSYIQKHAAIVWISTILALITLIAIMLSTLILRPLRRLMEGLKQSQTSGQFLLQGKMPNNEIGALADKLTRVFNQLENARDQAKRLANVAERTENLVIITNAKGEIEWVNKSFMRFTGYSLDEIAGKKPGDVLQGPETDEQTVQRIRNALRIKEGFVEEIINYTKEGEPYWVNVDAQPVLDENGEIQMYIAIESDVSERKAYIQRIDTARQAALNAVAARSEFLANMSHEIRTPMTAILGFTDLLKEDLHSEDAPTHIRSIQRNGEHLLTLINDILDISKIEAGKMSVESIQTSIISVIGDVVSMMRLRATEKGLKLKVHYNSSIPSQVMTDPVRLRQILVNLIGNAIKFTKEGEITLEIRATRSKPKPSAIHLFDNQDAQMAALRIQVSDTGIGMSMEELAHLFKPFNQADGTTTRRFGGTGLGLSISRRLAKLMHGEIMVQSRPGHGSQFTLHLMTETTADATWIENASEVIIDDQEKTDLPHYLIESGKPKQSSGNQNKPLDDVHLLLVEDGVDNQRLIKMVMTRAGAHVDLAENGLEAVKKVRNQHTNHGYDLILMDMQMPIMDGYTATKTLRESGFDLPILALTAHAMEHERIKCLNAGCSDFATKPIQKEKLIKQAYDLIHNKRGQAA